jgi:hypothetical protein
MARRVVRVRGSYGRFRRERRGRLERGHAIVEGCRAESVAGSTLGLGFREELGERSRAARGDHDARHGNFLPGCRLRPRRAGTPGSTAEEQDRGHERAHSPEA